MLPVTYDVHVDGVRAELERVVRASKDWDGRVCTLQVTDAAFNFMELRALVSAPDADRLARLRADVREKLIEHVQASRPKA